MKPAEADHPFPYHRSRCGLEGRSPLPDHTSRSPRRSGQANDAPIRVQRKLRNGRSFIWTSQLMKCEKSTHAPKPPTLKNPNKKRFAQTVSSNIFCSASCLISRKNEGLFARTAPKVFALSGFVGLDVLGGLGFLSLEWLQQFPRVTSYMQRVTTLDKPLQILRTPAEPRRAP